MEVKKLPGMKALLSFSSMWKVCQEFNRNSEEKFSFVGLAYHLLRGVLGKGFVTTAAYRDGDLVGFCMTRGERIHRVVVRESSRGKGIGRMIVPREARLVYTPIRENVDGFYKNIGFREVESERPGLYKMVRK